MKKLISILVLLVLALNVSAAFPEVKASILKYEPTPAEQGKTVEVWLQFTNSGVKAERGFVRFVPEYPFSLPAGQSNEIDVGTISATEDKVVKFRVFVSPDAPNGESMIYFLWRFGATQDWIELEAPITLQTQDAALVIDRYDVRPSPIVPGQTVMVDLYLLNAGRIAVKNVDASIDVEDAFSTIGTGALKRVAYIAPGQVEKLSFELASDPSTEVKVYNVPVSLSYQDDRNKEYDSTAKISLVVNAEPELSLNVESTDFTDKKSPGTVSLKVINKGVVDLKYLTVTLVGTDQYEMLSPSNEAYVGNLDNDDFETVDFIIKPLVESPRLSVKLSFKDPYNVDFVQQHDLPLRIITDKDLGKAKSPVGTIIVVLLIVAGVWYWFKRRKKKK